MPAGDHTLTATAPSGLTASATVPLDPCTEPQTPIELVHRFTG